LAGNNCCRSENSSSEFTITWKRSCNCWPGLKMYICLKYRTAGGQAGLGEAGSNLSVSLITEIDQESVRIPEEAGKSFSHQNPLFYRGNEISLKKFLCFIQGRDFPPKIPLFSWRANFPPKSPLFSRADPQRPAQTRIQVGS